MPISKPFSPDTPFSNSNTSHKHENWQSDTARWTSNAYHVQFATIEQIDASDEHDEAFGMSAWGLSRNLQQLLVDYADSAIRHSTRWMAAYQNQLVADALQDMVEQAMLAGENIPDLQDLFIAIETELYLPHGLRMPVCCVTNIIPRGSTPAEGMDKFVAILDPSETRAYINERSGNVVPTFEDRLH